MKWLTAAFAAMLVVIVILADRSQLPSILLRIRDFPGGDKVGHFLLMGMMSLLLNLSLRGARWRIGILTVLKGSLIIAAIAGAEEFSQKFFPSRTCSWLDLLADVAGIYCFGRIAELLMARRRISVQGI